jgi:cyanophycinase
MKKSAFFLAVVVSGCATAGTTGTAVTTGTAPGRLVIVGGGLSGANEPVYRAILGGRRGDGPFCVFPTAGAEPDSNMASPVATFNRYGGPGTAVGVLVSSQKLETAHDPKVVEQIKKCSGFWFIGGVQSRVIAAFRPQGKSTPAYEALMQRWREGAVVAGSSAGAAIMSDPMIAGGTSGAAMATGVRRISYIGGDADDTTGGVTIAPGLGFFDAALADQHFLARGRFGRLLTAMLELDQFDLSFGIDENTALVVDRDSVLVVGGSGVVVFDERTAKRTRSSVADITMHLLGDGDRYDLKTRRPSLAAAKSAVARDVPSPVAETDSAFVRFQLLRSLHALSRSSQPAPLTMRFGGGRIQIRKVDGFQAVSAGPGGVESTPKGFGLTGLRLDIIR